MTRSRDPLRIGVLGCGRISRWAHLPILHRMAEVDLVAAADPDPAARSEAGRWTRRLHPTSDELLARTDVEAVIVAVPTHLHPDLAEAACAAGKHVYLEKPVAAARSDAARLAAAAERAGVIVAVGFNRRVHPTFQRARAILRSGVIGTVRAVQARLCEPVPPGGLPGWKRRRATGGGVLLDLASHHADATCWLLDEEIVGGEAQVSSDVSEHDTARVQWTLKGAAAVQGFYSFRAGSDEVLVFLGERGVLRVDRHRFRVSVDVSGSGRYASRRRVSLPRPSELMGRAARLVGHVYEPSYRRALRAFVASVRGDSSELAGLDDGLRALDAVLMVEP